MTATWKESWSWPLINNLKCWVTDGESFLRVNFFSLKNMFGQILQQIQKLTAYIYSWKQWNWDSQFWSNLMEKNHFLEQQNMLESYFYTVKLTHPTPSYTTTHEYSYSKTIPKCLYIKKKTNKTIFVFFEVQILYLTAWTWKQPATVSTQKFLKNPHLRTQLRWEYPETLSHAKTKSGEWSGSDSLEQL